MAEICHHRIESYNPIFKIFSKEKKRYLKSKEIKHQARLEILFLLRKIHPTKLWEILTIKGLTCIKICHYQHPIHFND